MSEPLPPTEPLRRAARPPSPETPPAAPPVPPSPTVPEIALEPALPGVHRGGFTRLPTAPLDITVQSAPEEPSGAYDPEIAAQWLVPPPAAPRRGLASWALVFSIAGVLVSLFVGWGFPIGIVGVVSAVLALRRPLESRGMAVWALVLGVLSIVYSIGWLLYAASRASLFG